MNSQKKKILFTGLALIIGAFLCVAYVFYFMLNAQQAKTAEIDALKEKMVVLNSEIDVVQRKAEGLEKVAGKTLSLKTLLLESGKVYGNKEFEIFKVL